MMENRSFDHMLGYLTLSGRAEVDGLEENDEFRDRYANRQAPGEKAYYPAPLEPDRLSSGPPHTRPFVNQQLDLGHDGQPRMTGFVRALGHSSDAERQEVMSYQLPNNVWAFDFLAERYAISDRWFSAVPASTQPNRLMFMCGKTTRDAQSVELPRLPTVYEWLNEHGVTWHTFYRGNWPFITLMPHPSLGEHMTRDHDLTRFREVWRSPECPSVVFVEPRYWLGPLQPGADDDHPHAGATIRPGQLLIHQLLDAIASNQDRWRKTLLVITYDEHGGLFDHVSPPQITTSCGTHPPFAFLGPRVPAIVVSPCVIPRSVLGRDSQHVFDHTSILKFVGARWGDGKYSPEVDARPVSSLAEFVRRDAAEDDVLAVPQAPAAPEVLQMEAAGPENGPFALPDDALPIAAILRRRIAEHGAEAVLAEFPDIEAAMPLLNAPD
jgi:phospholipase C